MYVGQRDDFSTIPPFLLDLLGQLEFVMELDLESREKLALAEPKQVIRQIKEAGFYLQLPPQR